MHLLVDTIISNLYIASSLILAELVRKVEEFNFFFPFHKISIIKLKKHDAQKKSFW